MATASPAIVFSSERSTFPQLIEYLEAMEERMVSRLLDALRPMHGVGALEQTLTQPIPVNVPPVKDAILTETSSANNDTTSWTPSDAKRHKASRNQQRSGSVTVLPLDVKRYKHVAKGQERMVKYLRIAFKGLKPYSASDEYYLDVAQKKPLLSLSRTEEYILLHQPRVVPILKDACNTPLPDISSDEECSDTSSLFSSVSSCSTLPTEAPLSPKFDEAIGELEDLAKQQLHVDDDERTVAEIKAPNGAVSVEQSSTTEHTKAPESSGDASKVPAAEHTHDSVTDQDNTVHVAAADVHETQPGVLHPTQPADTTTRGASTIGPSIIPEAASQTDAMEVCIPESPRPQQVDSLSTHSEVGQAMDGVESPSASRDTSNTGKDDMDDIQVTSRVDTEDQSMTDAPPPQFSLNSFPGTYESRARSRVQTNARNHWSNGKTDYLLILIPDLHLVLQQALPKMDQERQRNHLQDEIFDDINTARSARELAGNLDFAMTNKLLTFAQFNKLEAYAKEMQTARRQKQQQDVDMSNVSNTPTNNQIGSSQTVANGAAQSASLPGPTQTLNVGAAAMGPIALLGQEPVAPEPKSNKDRLTLLLFEARTKMATTQDPGLTNFRSQFNLSFQNPSDKNVMVEYLIKHPRFQAPDSKGVRRLDAAKTVEIVEALVKDENPAGCEEIIWRCMEALAAQDVKAENEALSVYITCAKRQKPLEMLFDRISVCNLALRVEVNGDGCLTWDEMKDLAKTQETHYFQDNTRNRSNLPAYRQYIQERRIFWGNRINMKNLIADRIAARILAMGQAAAAAAAAAGAFGATVPPKVKRSLAGKSQDDEEPASKRVREEPAELTEEEERAAMRKRGARGPADSDCDDRVKQSRD